MRRVIALILSIAMVASLCTGLAITGFADLIEGDFSLNRIGYQTYIIGYKGEGGNVIIPSVLGENKSIAICKDAFKNCIGLTSIELSEAVNKIEDYAFNNCTNLTSVKVNRTEPPRLGDFDEENVQPFKGCSNLTAIYVPAASVEAYKTAWPDYASIIQVKPEDFFKFENDGNGGVKITGIKTGVSLPADLVIPSTLDGKPVTSIDDSAFEGKTDLQSVTIPDSVTAIGDGAFEECTGLISVTVKATTPPALGTKAFNNCNNVICVPKESVQTYKEAAGWSAYVDKITALAIITINGIDIENCYGDYGANAPVVDGNTITINRIITNTNVEIYIPSGKTLVVSDTSYHTTFIDGDLNITGSGTLVIYAVGFGLCGLWATGDIVIDGCIVDAAAGNESILANNITIEKGSEVTTAAALSSAIYGDSITIKEGSIVTATSLSAYAIYGHNITITDSKIISDGGICGANSVTIEENSIVTVTSDKTDAIRGDNITIIDSTVIADSAAGICSDNGSIYISSAKPIKVKGTTYASYAPNIYVEDELITEKNIKNGTLNTQDGYMYITATPDTDGFVTIKKINRLYFEAVGGDGTIKLNKMGSPSSVSLVYSTDRVSWQNFVIDKTYNVPNGTKFYIRASDINTNFNKDNSNCYKFVLGGDGSFNCGGSVMSLYTSSCDSLAIPSKGYFTFLFSGCEKLLTPPELPATTLTESCYSSIFTGCKNLITAPELPATILAPHCYQDMFFGCQNLISAPELPAITLTDYCYSDMFYQCLSLVSAPELPATTLAKYCYYCMFENCVKLENPPVLPAITLTDSCYAHMFAGCVRLEKAPILPATVLAPYCYSSMFNGCQDLNNLTANLKELSENSIDLWLKDVNKTGTFYTTNKNITNENKGDYNIPAGWTVNIPDNCLYFEIAEGTEGTIKLAKFNTPSSIELVYSDGSEWKPFDIDTEYTVRPGQKFYIRASDTNAIFNRSAFFYFFDLNGEAKFNCHGSIMSLVTSSCDLTEIPSESYFNNLFYDCKKLLTAPKLPATILTDNCYFAMFYGCTSLTNAPELPATTLALSCYSSMFNGCTSLITAPKLPAEKLANKCYESMFYGCTSLVTAPELPAKKLANKCYESMFYGCTSLVAAPELPAEELADYCYSSMFNGCKNLINAPELPASTLVESCYYSMFSGCENLHEIIANFTTSTELSKSIISYFVPISNIPGAGYGVIYTDYKEQMESIFKSLSYKLPSGWSIRQFDSETDYIYIEKDSDHLSSNIEDINLPYISRSISIKTDSDNTYNITVRKDKTLEALYCANDTAIEIRDGKKLTINYTEHVQGKKPFPLQIKYGNLTVKGNGTLEVNNDTYVSNFSFFVQGGNMNVDGATIDVSALNAPKDSKLININDGKITILDGTINANISGERSYAIFAQNIDIFGGTINAIATGNDSSGIYALNKLNIYSNDASVNAQGKISAYYSKEIYINDDAIDENNYSKYFSATDLSFKKSNGSDSIKGTGIVKCIDFTGPFMLAIPANCLSFESSASNLNVKFEKIGNPNRVSLLYTTASNIDGTDVAWFELLADDLRSIGAGEKIYIKTKKANDAFSNDSNNYYHFSLDGDGNIKADGSIMSLIDSECISEILPSDYCFYGLFKDNTKLTTGPVLPSTELKNKCYSNMFNGCSNLNEITLYLDADKLGTDTENWLNGVATTGTAHVIDADAYKNIVSKDASTIPVGWSFISLPTITVTNYKQSNFVINEDTRTLTITGDLECESISGLININIVINDGVNVTVNSTNADAIKAGKNLVFTGSGSVKVSADGFNGISAKKIVLDSNTNISSKGLAAYKSSEGIYVSNTNNAFVKIDNNNKAKRYFSGTNVISSNGSITGKDFVDLMMPTEYSGITFNNEELLDVWNDYGIASAPILTNSNNICEVNSINLTKDVTIDIPENKELLVLNKNVTTALYSSKKLTLANKGTLTVDAARNQGINVKSLYLDYNSHLVIDRSSNGINATDGIFIKEKNTTKQINNLDDAFEYFDVKNLSFDNESGTKIGSNNSSVIKFPNKTFIKIISDNEYKKPDTGFDIEFNGGKAYVIVTDTDESVELSYISSSLPVVLNVPEYKTLLVSPVREKQNAISVEGDLTIFGLGAINANAEKTNGDAGIISTGTFSVSQTSIVTEGKLVGLSATNINISSSAEVSAKGSNAAFSAAGGEICSVKLDGEKVSITDNNIREYFESDDDISIDNGVITSANGAYVMYAYSETASKIRMSVIATQSPDGNTYNVVLNPIIKGDAEIEEFIISDSDNNIVTDNDGDDESYTFTVNANEANVYTVFVSTTDESKTFKLNLSFVKTYLKVDNTQLVAVRSEVRNVLSNCNTSSSLGILYITSDSNISSGEGFATVNAYNGLQTKLNDADNYNVNDKTQIEIDKYTDSLEQAMNNFVNTIRYYPISVSEDTIKVDSNIKGNAYYAKGFYTTSAFEMICQPFNRDITVKPGFYTVKSVVEINGTDRTFYDIVAIRTDTNVSYTDIMANTIYETHDMVRLDADNYNNVMDLMARVRSSNDVTSELIEEAKTIIKQKTTVKPTGGGSSTEPEEETEEPGDVITYVEDGCVVIYAEGASNAVVTLGDDFNKTFDLSSSYASFNALKTGTYNVHVNYKKAGFTTDTTVVVERGLEPIKFITRYGSSDITLEKVPDFTVKHIYYAPGMYSETNAMTSYISVNNDDMTVPALNNDGYQTFKVIAKYVDGSILEYNIDVLVETGTEDLIILKKDAVVYIGYQDFKDVQSIAYIDGKYSSWNKMSSSATKELTFAPKVILNADSSKLAGYTMLDKNDFENGTYTFYISYVDDSKRTKEILKTVTF